jgi:hypothetical protein
VEEPNNLNRPRPDEWKRGDLFPFIEECWSNSVAVVARNNVVAARFTAIDVIFAEAQQNLKPASHKQVVPALLLLRSFSAFRAAVMVGLSLPTDGFPLQRSCLEYAGYAKLIFDNPDAGELWLKREEDAAKVRSTFTNRGVRESIAKDDEPLSKVYQELYERTIDFGAHPNEKGVLGSVVRESVGTGNLQVSLLVGDSLELQHGLKTCAQVAICSLKIFNLIFTVQFSNACFESKILAAQKPF